MARTSLFVQGLPWAVDDDALFEAFTPHGNVVEAKVVLDKYNGRSRGFGIVSYDSMDGAQRALVAMNGADMGGRYLRVKIDDERKTFGGTVPSSSARRVHSDASEHKSGEGTNLFVNGLPWSVDDDALYEAFKPHGTIVEAKVVLDRRSGRSRGFGIVSYDSADAAQRALVAMNGADMGGRYLHVKVDDERKTFPDVPRRAAPSSPAADVDAPEGAKLFINGLPWTVDDAALYEAFAGHGNVLAAEVILDRYKNRSRGFGFVTYDSADAAQNALLAMNGSDLGGRYLEISIARAKKE